MPKANAKLVDEIGVTLDASPSVAVVAQVMIATGPVDFVNGRTRSREARAAPSSVNPKGDL